MDVLIIKLGALGDVVNTLPLAISIKKELGACIYWLVAPLSHPLLVNHPAVDQTILFTHRRGAAALATALGQCRSRHFDIVLDLQRIIKSGLLCCAARSDRKIGFDRGRCKELTWLLPFERIPPGDPHAHMVHQYLDFARYMGLSGRRIEWGLTSDGSLPQVLPVDFVVLNIGATKPANRWMPENFAALALRIHDCYGLQSVLTGGIEDIPMAKAIQTAADGAVFNLAGRTTLPELVSVLDRAVAVVACDTGPMHLAVALGKKVLALFGPSDHRRTGPYKGKVIRARISCGPCSRKICDLPKCMDAITPDLVLSHLNGFLQ